MSEDLEKTIGNKCIQYFISRSQRDIEISKGLGTIGTEGYSITGCYSCNGYNNTCKFYLSNSQCFDDEKEYIK